jgi:hypothetical protein
MILKVPGQVPYQFRVGAGVHGRHRARDCVRGPGGRPAGASHRDGELLNLNRTACVCVYNCRN